MSQEVKVLSESRLWAIVSTIPESKDRAAMMVHLSVTGTWNSDAQPTNIAERQSIIDWIRATWTSQTVRAKMARKIADQIESLKHRGVDE